MTITMAAASLFAFASLAAFPAMQDRPSPQEEAHIAELVRALPSASLLRSALEAGGRGDGVHHSWMDDMRRQGVKRAWIIVYLGLSKRPQDIRVDEAAYYSGYDGGASQITDAQWLERIRKSGLASTLEKVAVAQAPHNSWYKHDTTFVPIDLLDDEWLPPTTYSAAQAHLKAVARQLKPRSDLRLDLAHATGGGTDYVWMSQMRTEGIRRAVVSINIDFRDDGVPKDMKVNRVRYYTAYDDEKALVSDASFLGRIRASGLEETLREVALRGTEKGFWLDVPEPRPVPFTGGASVEFYDDPWLPFYERPLFYAKYPSK
jgi:hypothetical protein